VRGQLVELIAHPPAGTETVRFFFAGEHKVDISPPFRVLYETGDLSPRTYNWSAFANDGDGPMQALEVRGTARVHPLPVVPDFVVSALVVAGTPQVVGIVVSNVAPRLAVQAWAFDQASAENMKRVPLRLSRTTRSSQTFRLARGPLHAEENGMLQVEVAPRRLIRVHGAELRGRTALLWLRENKRTGTVLAHQTRRSDCTVRAARSGDHGQPQRMNCYFAPRRPPVPLQVHFPG
jgi:hypothetical protein